MRLHLPIPLRSALLAGFVSAAAFLSVTLVPSASAAAFDFAWDEATHTLTVSSSADRADADTGILISSNASDPGELSENEHYADATKIVFNLSDPGSNAVWFVGNNTVSTQDIQIGDGSDATKGLRFNDGSSNTTLTFSGTVTGNGVISQSGGASNKSIQLTGNVTDFTGTVAMNNSRSGTIRFGNGGVIDYATTANKGVSGTGAFTMGSAEDTIAYNYGGGIGGAPVYVTNTITGNNGVLAMEGAADMQFVNAVSVGTLRIGSDAGRVTSLYIDPATAVVTDGTDLVFNQVSFGTLNNSGNGVVQVYGAGGSLTVKSTGTGNTIVNGGDFSSLYAINGTTSLVGEINITSQFRGGSNSSPTINIGTADQAAHMTVNEFYGHWEFASEAAATNRTIVNVNNGSVLNVSSVLQIARDGKGILNINEGGTVLVQRLDLGTASSSWTGTPANGKQGTVNLNGGELYVGSNGITQNNNAEQSPGVLHFESGLLGGTDNWSTSLDMTVGGEGKSLTIHTGKYDAATQTRSSSDGLTITLGKVTGTAGTLVKDGVGTLTMGSGSSLNGLTLSNGYLNVNGADGSLFGALTVGNLTTMTDQGGKFWIDLGAGNAADKITASSYGNQLVNLALSGTATGTYTVFDGGTGLTDTSNIKLDLFMNRGLSVDETSGISIENGVVKVTVTGAASTETFTLTWNGADGETWSNTQVTAWSRTGVAEERFSQGDQVVFNGQGVSEVNIAGVVNPGSITVSGTKDYSFLGGSIRGNGALVKNGTGSLALNTNLADWTGAITLNGGSLEIFSDLLAVTDGGQMTVGGAATLAMGGNVARTTVLNAGLTVSVANGAEVAHSGLISGTGGLTKSGAGTLILSNNGNTFAGNLSITEGVLKMGSGATGTSGALGAFNIDDGSTRVISILDGATLDMNGKVDNRYAITLAGHGVDGSGALINTGGNAWYGKINFPKITLAADAGIGGTGNICIVGPGFAATTLNLAGYTLTKTGSNTLELVSTTITSGTVAVQEGTLKFSSAGSDYNASAADMVVGAQGTLDITARNISLKSLSGNGGTVNLGEKTLTVGGGSFAGTINGTGGLTVTGNGADAAVLTLSGSNTSTGLLTVTHAADVVRLGTDSQEGGWVGTTLGGAGTLEVVNGSLISAMSRVDGASAGIAVNAGENKAISLGGTATDMLTSIALGKGSTLSGVNGNIVVGDGGLSGLALTLDTSNTASLPLDQPLSGVEGDAKILQGSGATLTINDATKVSLTMDAVVNTLLNRNTYLTLTDGTLVCSDINGISLTTTGGDSLLSYGLRIVGTDGGSLLLTSNPQSLYLVSSDAALTNPHMVNEYNALSSYAGVLVQGGETLTLNLPGVLPLSAQTAGGMVINNLAGGSEEDADNKAQLVVNNTDASGGNVKVILNNERLPLSGTTVVDPTPFGGDTSFYGHITGNAGVTFIKQGADDLTVYGSVKADTLRVEEGSLSVKESGNVIQNVELAGSGDSVLTFGGDVNAGTLSEANSGASLVLENGASLTLMGGGSLSRSSITGNGSLSLGDTLSLSGTSVVQGDILLNLTKNAVSSGALDIGSTDGSAVAGVTGNGAVKSSGGTLTINTGDSGEGAVFSGALEGSGKIVVSGNAGQTLQAGNAAYELTVNSGTLTVKGTEATPALAYKNIVVGNASTFRVEAVSGESGAANTTVSAENVVFDAGSTTEWIYNVAQDTPFGAGMLTADTITIGEGAQFVISNMAENTSMASSDDLENVLLMSANSGITGLEDGGSLDAALSGLFAVYYKDATLNRVGNDIVFNAIVRDDNLFVSAGVTHNSAAGADLLWNARHGLDFTSQLGKVMEAVSTMVSDGNRAGASRALAAVAGSTVNALGTAQRDALRDQMGWIRNRTTQMGVNPAYVNQDMPYFHMWMEGTGSYAKLDSKGDESGYELTSWGGTVGMDVDVSDHLTVGAAFTANYGDLSASAADVADGHLDSYYANLFARYQSKKWAHTLILTGGWNDGELNRSVNYGTGSYKTQGSTNGWGFGAMYELTYDIFLNESKSSMLQPLFNASIVTTSMDGYTESGAGNAGLNVGKQEWTTGTLALGGRWMGLVGSNIFGREALAELRANVAQDMGDDRGKTGVGVLANPGYMQTVHGAEVGTTALQLGVGLSVPVGTKGTIFVNGNADIRDGASSVSGNVGYRYDF